MNVHDYRFLLSEQGALQKLIAQSSPENMIGRMSLESRLSWVEEELDAYKEFSPDLVDARLTFQGRPVIGSRAIHADFGSAAIGAFAEAVTRIGASQRSPLASSGPIPDREDYQVLITGVASGSFGFQIEDASQQPAFAGESTPVEHAIERVKEILEASVGTDDQLLEAIAETDRRALDAVQDFLRTLTEYSAVCALEFRGEEFRFRDPEQIRRSESRLGEDNVLENDVEFTGRFQGFLPKSRRAEFSIVATDVSFLRDFVGTVSAGRVESKVVESIDINDILNLEVKIKARTKRVGEGRPRYTITSCATL